MKRMITMLFLFCLVGFIHGGDVQQKLGPGLRALLGEQAVGLKKMYASDSDGWVRVFVRGDSPATAVAMAGGEVQTDLGHLVTARVSLDAVIDVAESEDVAFVRLGSKVHKRNDRVVADIRADLAHGGQSPLTQSYTGEGVVVGIIDTGIDPTHGDFQHPDGTTRILYLWDQLSSDGDAPTGFGYGTEWTKADIDNGLCTHTDEDGHGTHVSGTAAGNGLALGEYDGVAPDAEIIVVSLDFVSSVGVIDAANYIYQKADALGMPCVINASLGWHQGMHDGTSIDEQAIGTMVEAKAGRAFCAAAGNEGTDFIHLTFPNTSDSLFSYYHAGPDGIVLLYVRVPDAYLTTTQFSIGVDDHDYDPLDETGGPTSYLGRTPWYSAQDVLNDGDGEILETLDPGGVDHGRVTFAVDVASNSLGATGLLILIEDTDLYWNDETGIVENLDLYRLNVWGGKSSIHVWLADVGMAYVNGVVDARYRAPDNDYSVGLPATGEAIIGVGASVSRTEWESVDGYTYGVSGTLGDLADFSSHGPTADGRIKPDLTAPGHAVISSIPSNAYDDELFLEGEIVEGYLHGSSSGTSMSSPAAAGAVALLYERYGNLSHDQLMQTLADGARSDTFTGGSLPNNDWGYGKMDVFNMLTGTPVQEDGVRPGEFVLYPNTPNPFNPMTTVSFQLPYAAHVTLSIYNINGQLIETLIEERVEAGRHRIDWHAGKYSSGLYVYQIEAGAFMARGKCVLLK